MSAFFFDDTVLVADGHYHEHIDFLGKNITVTSEDGPETTIIDGDIGTGPVVRFRQGETRIAVLHGFTIEHGTESGISIDHAFPTITGNIITQNTGNLVGGGIVVRWGGPLVDSNTISQNLASVSGGAQGGGINVMLPSDLPARITNNEIVENFSGGYGGGIEIIGAGPVVVENNLISGNRAGREGGGIHVANLEGGAVIVQNLIADNAAPSGSGLYALTWMQFTNNTVVNNDANTTGVVVPDDSGTQTKIENNIIVASGTENGLLCNPMYHGGFPIVRFNDVFSSQGVDTAYAGDCSGFSGTNGNISDDPLFVSSTDDFHLLADSPAIDAGDNSAPNLPELDLDGNPRIVNGHGTGTPIIDMGVYEFQPCGGSSGNANKYRLGLAKQGSTQ